MFYSDIVNIIRDTFGRFKGVGTTRYQGDDLNNAQHNDKTLQVYIDDISYHQLNITTNVFTVEYNIYILGHPTEEPDGILDIQDQAYNVAANVIAYLDYNSSFRGILSIHDYSIITVAHYTAQDSAGVKISLQLEVPSPVNLCDIDSLFNAEPVQPDPDKEIDIDEYVDGPIDVQEIRLPKTRPC